MECACTDVHGYLTVDDTRDGEKGETKIEKARHVITMWRSNISNEGRCCIVSCCESVERRIVQVDLRVAAVKKCDLT